MIEKLKDFRLLKQQTTANVNDTYFSRSREGQGVLD